MFKNIFLQITYLQHHDDLRELYLWNWELTQQSVRHIAHGIFCAYRISETDQISWGCCSSTSTSTEISAVFTICWVCSVDTLKTRQWWRHQMETSSASRPFVRGIHRSPVNSPHKGQLRRTLIFSLIGVWINGWVNNRHWGWTHEGVGRHPRQDGGQHFSAPNRFTLIVGFCEHLLPL